MQDQERPQDAEYAADAADSPSAPVDAIALLEEGLLFESERPDEGDTSAEGVGDDALDGDDDSEDDEDLDGDAEEDDSEDDEPEPEEDGEPEDQEPKPRRNRAPIPPEEIMRHARAVAQNPKAVTQVPRRALADVFQQVAVLAHQSGVLAATKEFQQRAAGEEKLREFVAERDELKRDNPEGFTEWADANAEEAERYYAARRYLAARESAPDQAPATDPAVIQQQANQQFQRLEGLPDDVRSALVDRVNAGEFALTDEGLAALQGAVDAAFKEALTAAPSPAKKRAQARSQAQQARQGLARPIVSTGEADADKNPISHITDVDELLSMAATGE